VQHRSGTFSPWARAHAAEAMAVYYRDIDPERELEAWLRAAADNPRNPRYTTSIGNVAAKLDRLDVACPMYERSYELGMRRFDIVYNLALCGMRTGRPADAERYANELVERWPKDRRGLTARAEARVQLGRPAAALEDLQLALQMAPLDPQVHFLRARAYRAMGDAQAARAAAQRALELDPKHAAARQLLEGL
jgi:tetratricopeptide (TPR) repeat protein